MLVECSSQSIPSASQKLCHEFTPAVPSQSYSPGDRSGSLRLILHGFLIDFLQWNCCKSLAVLRVCISCSARIRSGSWEVPSGVKIRPANFTFLKKKSHFSRLNFSFCMPQNVVNPDDECLHQ